MKDMVLLFAGICIGIGIENHVVNWSIDSGIAYYDTKTSSVLFR